MNKNDRLYKQKGDTCAISCMMMVLEYYKIIEKANWYDERRLYRIYGSEYMRGTPFSALVFHMAKNGLDVAIYHEDENLFNNNQLGLSSEDFALAMNEYKEYLKLAENKGARILNGININTDMLKKELENGNLVILAGQISGMYHAILLTGYNENLFEVCDPLYNEKQTRTFSEIDEYMNTNIGKWCITVNDKTKEKTNSVS